MTNPALINDLSIAPFNDSVVTVTLRSIRHIADASNPVSKEFNIRFIVNDGNEMLDFQEIITLSPGERLNVQNVFHHFNYEDTNCEDLLNQGMTFFTHITARGVSECADYHAGGKLKPGRFNFRIPVMLQTGSRKSTLVLRGTIHVSCPDDDSAIDGITSLTSP